MKEHVDLEETTKEFLIKWLNGENVQYYNAFKSQWIDITKRTPLASWNNFEGNLFRVRPDLIKIENFEIPKPVTKRLDDLQKYYIPDFERDLVHELIWKNDETDNCLLFSRVIFLTNEDARSCLIAFKGLMR